PCRRRPRCRRPSRRSRRRVGPLASYRRAGLPSSRSSDPKPTKEDSMSTGGRLAILGAVIVAAVVGIIVAGSGSSGAPKTANVTIDVKNAKPVGGVKKIKLKQGGTLHLTVHS